MLDEVEQKIILRIGSLPDEAWLLMTKTVEQLRYWLSLRVTYEAVQVAWLSRVYFLDDPLLPLVKSRALTQNDYNRIWQAVEYYQRLWALVQLSEPFVRDEFARRRKDSYPFSSAYELFSRIVQEQVGNHFATCLTPYKEVSATKYEKAARALARLHQGEALLPREEAVLKPLLAAESELPCMTILLHVAKTKASPRRAALKNALEDFQKSAARLCEFEATHIRSRGSFAWVDGDRVKGSRDSTYRRQSS